ncbi:Chitinase domain-containing protein 1 [Hordeum vulgare]|nr:Chitinase domain-containing protein 1 [Hordeum vulgare]
MGWRKFFLGCLFGDRAKSQETMKVYSNFTSMEEVHKEADVVVNKATTRDLKMVIPGPAKGTMSVDILPWAMNQANSGDAQQRAKWTKYKEYIRPNDDCVMVYWTTRTMVDSMEEDNEVQMVAKAQAAGDRVGPIVLDRDDEEQDKQEEYDDGEERNLAPHRRSTQL